ncbi:MAG: homocysteine S-methyltransferase family protein, partial [Planctomycetota bacterium]
HEGVELPEFSAVVLMQDDDHREWIREYNRGYMRIAIEGGLSGYVLESSTWRGSFGWAGAIGLSEERLDELNRLSIEDGLRLREEFKNTNLDIVISGNIGPIGDAYWVEHRPTVDAARHYHARQVQLFAETDADMVHAMTIPSASECAAIALAAKEAGMPCAISFTVETNGKLPSGETMEETIALVDETTDAWVAYFGINCAHPEHFDEELSAGHSWRDRVRSIRGNASRCSHEELDHAEELDEGNPEEYGTQLADLHARFPNLNILGGCCGTDHRHVGAIVKSMARDCNKMGNS